MRPMSQILISRPVVLTGIALIGVMVITFSAASFLNAAAKKGNRATALKLAELVPEPLEGWKATKPRISWVTDGSAARARYWSIKGRERFSLVIEKDTQGLNYKRDLLKNRKKAARRGYRFKTINGQLAMVKKGFEKREVRIWLGKNTLVFAVGPAKLEAIEEHLKTMKLKVIAGVR